VVFIPKCHIIYAHGEGKNRHSEQKDYQGNANAKNWSDLERKRYRGY
jgi:hypothetical protein